jgi:Ca2+-transporting ATPase
MVSWWQLEIQDAAKTLETDIAKGLSSNEAKIRLEKHGTNQLKEKKGHSALGIFLDQFRDFIIWVLIGAAGISGFLGEWLDALVIMVIVILNAVMGFVQEYRAEKSLAALKKLSSPTSKIIRDGEHSVIESSQLVPGDLIELESGDNVPADSRIVWLTSNFSIQEASLTGESTPVNKIMSPLKDGNISLADRTNMAYMGTSVTHGKARAVVAETGMNTELGKITGMIQDIGQVDTPLQKRLEQFSKWIVYVCLAVVGMVFIMGLIRESEAIRVLFNGDVLGFLRNKSVTELFITAVSLAVAAIPEGLPAVVTIALALGVQRMVRRHALIRKLPSVETLGCVTTICSDKTGTLTKNEMTIRFIYAGGKLYEVTGTGYDPKGEFLLDKKTINPNEQSELSKTLLSGVLCNGAQLVSNNGSYKILGDPTEGAILTSAAKMGLWKDRLENDYPFIDEIPFDSERKKMTIIRKNSVLPLLGGTINGNLIAYVKGAPDILLNDCINIEQKGVLRSLNDEERQNILKTNNDLADQAMRVLAIACKNLESTPEKFDEKIESELTFLGLVAMIDPPREEVKDAIQKCKSAGINTVMITGDHKSTAVAIASELDFYGEGSIALTGEELDKLSDEEFEKEIKKVSVYARVSPEHKLRIVRTRRKLGEIVAMTGDGVNDAPAVKEADIGVAMGITGTDVTKEVSDMVITDDNFASIVSAVEEGRGIYDNIKKSINYLLSCNAGEILVMFVASLFGMPMPLSAIQILWVNLVTDGLPALALGVDPVEPKIMNRDPRPPDEPVLTKLGGTILIAQGVFIAFCTLLAFSLSLYFIPDQLNNPEGPLHAMTMAFIVISVSQKFHSFNCRSNTESIFKLGLFSNRKLLYANLISFSIQMAAIYVPFLQSIFKTVALSPISLASAIIISSFPLWAMEIFKVIIRAKNNKQT